MFPSSASASPLSSLTVSGRRSDDRDLRRGRGPLALRVRLRLRLEPAPTLAGEPVPGMGAKYGAPYGCVRGARGGDPGERERDEGAENVETDEKLERGESGGTDAGCPLERVSDRELSTRRGPDGRRGAMDGRGGVTADEDATGSVAGAAAGIEHQ